MVSDYRLSDYTIYRLLLLRHCLMYQYADSGEQMPSWFSFFLVCVDNIDPLTVTIPFHCQGVTV
jgi:hypothetical protein